MTIFSSHDAGTWVDPAEPHVLRDEWLGQLVAFVYIPRHRLPAALVSPSLVVVRDLTALMERPLAEVTSAWGPTTFLVRRAQAPGLLAELRLAAEFIDRLLTEIDRVLAQPARRDG